MAQAIPLVLAGGQAYLSNQQNEMADRRQKEAMKGQDALIGMQTDLFKVIKEAVTTAEKMGQFDPERQIAQLDKDVSKNQGRDMGNLGAGMNAAGYRPGDSEIGTRMDAVNLKYRDFRDRTANDIRNNAFTQKLQAYQAIGGQQLNPGIGVMGQRAEMAGQQRGNPGAFWQSLMPFLGQQKQQGSGFQLPGGGLESWKDINITGF
jgi:hypothetical protein